MSEVTTETLYGDDPYLRECDAQVLAADERGVVLDRTIFYAVGGGQPGDTGTLTGAEGSRFDVVDTRRIDGDHVHVLAEGSELPAVGSLVRAALDWERRHRLMRMHTCLHLLGALVPAGVTGGNISEVKSRLDFDMEDQLDKETLTEGLNRLIAEDHPIARRWITQDELAAQPELVRTMSVQPPTHADRVRLLEIEGVDLQPCGGTHVNRTGEIGAVRVSKIEKKGRHNRRVNVVFD